ncbi:tyrosine-type recombinase/integrase [Pseudomonas syringae]|uniref:tyrosine-type recombinase/integrase n=1 Tax=Pseudomonas syringae TaxID=317 RepID=UPI001BE40151|nr:tyrosine-type recombinase/integrase [Pseudomonas syringae]QWB08733.1 tyrosine-type recombinase/integrase [Pseudomonas syringae]
MADNLIQKKGESTWYVRLAVPIDVQSAMGGKTVLIQSLKTGLRSEAMTRRLSVLAGWKADIAKARTGKPLPPDWQDSFAASLEAVDTVTKWSKAARVGVDIPLPVPVPNHAEMQEFIRANPELERVMKGLVQKADQVHMGQFKLSDEIGEMFKTAVAQRYETRYTPTADQKEEIRMIAAGDGIRKVRSPITKQRIANFRQYREARNVATKTIDQQQSKLEKLSTYLTKEGKPLDFDAVSAWLDSFKLASKTLTQYLLAGNVFWKWAMKHDFRWREDFKDKANPFENHELPQTRGKERADRQRKDFQPKEIAELHAAALAADHMTLADLILLGAYTGARIEELCQLRVEHLIEPDGIDSFDIIDSKTAAGIRVVPVHPALSNIVERLKEDSKDGFLIPSGSKNKYAIRSDALSKAFGRLKEAQGYGPQHVFHSIRKTVITQLVRAEVQGTLIAELVGHETGTVTFDVYSQGASSIQKLQAISKLKFPGTLL